MSNPGFGDQTPLPLSLARRVDEMCCRFEEAWKAGGEPPRLEAYLAEVAEPVRAALLRELLQIEAHHRRRAGDEPRGADYYGRLPDLDPNLLATLLTPEQPEETPQRSGDPRPQHPAIGQSPVPGYEVLGVLGSGGMGVVFEARQLRLNRVVALKMIQGSRHIGAKARERFQREAQAVAQLQHANIVQVYEVGEHDGRPYLALEFVAGGSLDRYLGGTPLPAAVAASLVETLARAVHHAHERGVLHRDLKPANILLHVADRRPMIADLSDTDPSSQSAIAHLQSAIPKVTDFGLAKLLDESDASGATRSGEVLGTPGYMAPEQTEGKPGTTSPATDVYGLGAILYELLTGRPPFKAETALATLLLVRFEEPVSPSQLQPSCPRDLVTICLKCLHKEPRKRYASAAALADDLERYVGGRPIQARPVGVAERALKWVRRHPATTAWLGLVVALTVLGLTGIVWYAIHAEVRRHEAEQAQRDAQQRREEAEAALYYHRVTGAFHEWQACNLEQAERLLDPYAGQDRLPWEWSHVHGLCHTDLLTLGEPGDPVSCVVFSPDGRRLASGCSGGTGPGGVKLWDAATGQLLLTFQGRTAQITSLAFHPDGRVLAAADGGRGDDPGGAGLWDATTGQAIGPLQGCRGSVTGVAFSPDGRLLATAEMVRGVRLWDSTTRQAVTSLYQEDGAAYCVAFSPDGRRVASGDSQGIVRLWDATTHRQLHRLASSQWIRSVAFSPDGRYLAVARRDKTVEVWDANRGERLLSHPLHAGPVCSVAFHPDGLWLASADDTGLVQIYEALKVGQGRPLRGHTSAIDAVAFSPDGARLATAGRGGVVKVWDALRDQEFRHLPRQGLEVRDLAYSPDSRLLAVAGPMFGGTAGGPNEVRILDVESGEVRLRLQGHGGVTHGVAYSPDGKRLASASHDGTVRLWESATGKHLATLEGHTGDVFRVTFDPDGVRVASAGEDETVRLWSVPDGRRLHTLRGHTGQVVGLAFSPDGRLLASSGAGGAVCLWDPSEGKLLRRLEAHLGYASAVAFSPDGDWLASAGADKTVVLWEAATWREQFRRRGHSGAVTAVAFSPDGRRLASVGLDRLLKLWDLPTGAEVFVLRAPFSNQGSVAFRPDGRQLAAGGGEQFWVRLWDVEAPREERAARAAQAVPTWHRNAAAAAEKDRQWFAVVFHLSQLLAVRPAEAELHARRGWAFAELGRWDRADADCAQAVARGANAWHLQALLRLRAGDRAAYKTACNKALAALGPTPSAADSHRVAWMCVLAPGADPPRVVNLAQRAVIGDLQKHAYLSTLGAALYRAGRFADSLGPLLESVRIHGQGGSVVDSLYLALASQRLDRGAEARRWLDRATREIDNAAGPALPWDQRLERQLLRAEAEALVRGAKP